MFFSHANRLPFRFTCLAGGVQWCCLSQRDVFDSLISRVMFSSTSIWGKLWRFGAAIAFSASSVLLRTLTVAYWTHISVFFWSEMVWKKSCTLFFFWIPVSFEKLDMRGIDPRTSRMKSELSTIFATFPLRKLGANDNWRLSLLMQWLNEVFYCISF